MALFTRVLRTHSGNGRTGAPNAQLQDQFIKELTSQANAVLAQMSQQFTQDLQTQASQVLQGFSGGGAGDGNAYGGIAQLFSTGARYLVSKPKTTSSSSESDRSQEVTARFRLSQSQALAEANQTIARGDKNL